MLSWHYVTSEQYNAAEAEDKTSDKLFFLSDTKEIYRGTERFTQACELYTTTPPTTPAVGRLYIESTTLEGRIYNGSDWQTVIRPVVATLTSTDTQSPVSGKAVADYVATQLSGVSTDVDNALNGATYAKATSTLTFTRNSGEDPVAVKIDNMPVDLLYNDETGLLQLKDDTGAAIGTGINLDLERFVKSGEYDPDSKQITLYFDDEKQDSVTIDATALVDIYTGTATSTATTTVSPTNQISVAVKVSETAGNQLTTDGSGLYVAAPDLSGLNNKQDKDADAVENNIAKFDASGNTVDSGLKAGGATLAGSPAATTLATEAAVEAIRSALQTAIDGKIAKMSGATAGHIVTATSDGQVADSGKTVGGATLAGSPNANTVATEAAVSAAIAALNVGNKMDKDADAVANNLAKFDASGNAVDAGVTIGGATLAADPAATTVATEAAVEDCLTWKTTV